MLRSTGVISFAIGTSRVLGFLRDILFARFFGTDIFAQAFVVAFRLPNMLRDMIGEGATDAALVPVLSEYQHTRSPEEYWEAARVILNLMLTVLVTLSVIGVLSAPLLVKVMAPGFYRDPQLYSLTVSLTRWLFPYILMLGMVAYSKGVLNSFHYFTTPAFSSVVLNVTMIISLLVLCPLIGVKGLVAGILVGGILEVLLQVKPLKDRGLTFRRSFRLSHPIAGRIGKLLMPRALGSAVYQLSVLVDTVLASLAWVVGPGGVAALYYSNRLVQLPLAVFGIALATAALPRMSKEAASNDLEKLRNTVAFALKSVFTIMLPATAGLMVLSTPIVRILFERGEFTGYSTMITSSALFFYTFGLFAYAGIKILVSAFYSMGDTRTPVRTAAIALGVNLVLNLILMWPLKIGGLALATSAAAMVNLVMLFRYLSRRIGDIGSKDITRSLGRVGAATAVMALYLSLAQWMFLTGPEACGIRAAAVLAAMVVSGIAVYLIGAYAAGVEEIRKLAGLVRGKRRVSMNGEE
ncbi:MAG: murein biosynthesis integral membrane protein MurJ [Candidatus Omnitrophica bacterium]|nr:murein biosynthesis integral membrane protein MurJ [Candidatus Omnitrophota bacterium]